MHLDLPLNGDAMGLKGFFQGLGHRVRYGLGFVV